MDYKLLVETAGKLTQVNNNSAEEFIQKSENLINQMNNIMLDRPDIIKLIGTDNIQMMKDNHSNHIRFIISILKYPNPDVLVDTILWVFRAYRSHGFSTNYWAAQLNTWIIIIKKELSSESYSEIYPFYEWMQINIPLFVKVSDQKLESTNLLN